MKKLKTILPFLLLTLAVMGWSNRSILAGWWKALQHYGGSKTDGNGEDEATQKALLKEMTEVINHIRTLQSHWYLEASLSITDKYDPDNDIKNAEYIFCKSDSLFYLRFGKTEALNTASIYLFADHNSKKILISQAKSVIDPAGLPIGQLQTFLKDEGYTFYKKTEGSVITLSMINQEHFSCRELTLKYDVNTRKILKIVTRIPDINDNEHPDREKHCVLNIKEWDNQSDMDKWLKTDRFVTRTVEGWKPVAQLAEYEVVQ